ncbi:MAG: hypothetical protein JJE52_18705 [Acidimicrobiia bacterium]|nr:hypothetical protein [Acidimicrobiia bacterium]
MGRLGMLARRAARVPAAICSVLLDDGERVEQLVAGDVLGEGGVAVLTDRRLLVANAREWKPDVRSLAVGPELQVVGLGDDRSASLTFTGVGDPLLIENIGDTALAREMAQRVRRRTGQAS